MRRSVRTSTGFKAAARAALHQQNWTVAERAVFLSRPDEVATARADGLGARGGGGTEGDKKTAAPCSCQRGRRGRPSPRLVTRAGRAGRGTRGPGALCPRDEGALPAGAAGGDDSRCRRPDCGGRARHAGPGRVCEQRCRPGAGPGTRAEPAGQPPTDDATDKPARRPTPVPVENRTPRSPHWRCACWLHKRARLCWARWVGETQREPF